MPTATALTDQQRQDAYEARFVPKLASALRKSVARCISATEQGASPTVAAAYVTDTAVGLVLTQLYRTVAPAQAARTYEQLTEGQKAAAPPTVREGWLSRATRFIRGEGAQALRALTARTCELVQEVLEQAQVAGLGIPAASKLLREKVVGTSRARATAIVRSELTASSNYGSLLGAESTGLTLDKVWLNTNGARTRPTHQAAGGQVVDLRGSFTVGGFPARYPGDVLLPPAERVNCRCSIGYKPKE